MQQQGMGTLPVASMPVSHHSDHAEREADVIATRVLAGNVTAPPMASSVSPAIARQAPTPDPNPDKKKVLKEVHNIVELADIPSDIDDKKLRWFDVTKAFPVPPEKGPEGQKISSASRRMRRRA